MENKTTLEIIIDNAEFAREFNYFVTVQLDGDGEKVIILKDNLLIEKNRRFSS
jgi:hypothetical protein